MTYEEYKRRWDQAKPNDIVSYNGKIMTFKQSKRAMKINDIRLSIRYFIRSDLPVVLKAGLISVVLAWLFNWPFGICVKAIIAVFITRFMWCFNLPKAIDMIAYIGVTIGVILSVAEEVGVIAGIIMGIVVYLI